MSRVQISNKIKVPYIESYDSVSKLILSLDGNNSVPKLINGNIHYGDYVFIKADDGSTREADKSSKGKYFNRFENFYADTRSEKDILTWDNVVGDTLDSFYKINSFLVYAPLKSIDSSEYDITKINKALNIIAPDIAGRIKVEKAKENTNEMVYEIAVKFRLHIGGEPQYLINKFYFDSDYNLCDTMLSNLYYEQIERLIHNSDKCEKYDNIKISTDKVKIMTDKLLELMCDNGGFQDYLVGDAKEVYDTYNTEAVINGTDIGIIKCDRIKLRYIANLRVQNKIYYGIDSANNQPRIEIIVDANDRFTIKCLTCGEIVVLADNLIIPNEENGRESYKNIYTAETVDIMRSTVSSHLMNSLKECGDCTRILCITDMAVCSECGEMLCKNCERLSTSVSDGGKIINFHKRCGVFCEDLCAIMPKRQAKECEYCHKYYSISSFGSSNYYCEFCDSIFGENDYRDDLAALYRLHKNLLPMRLRKKGNICNENLDCIMFRVKKKDGFSVYAFDKNQLYERKLYKLKKLK